MELDEFDLACEGNTDSEALLKLLGLWWSELPVLLWCFFGLLESWLVELKCTFWVFPIEDVSTLACANED